jgi:hypothetical protein
MSSDEDSNDDLLTAGALLIHEHNVAQIPVYCGSVKGRSTALGRKIEHGHKMLFTNYLHHDKALLTPQMFRRQFRMSIPLFNQIMDGVKVYDGYILHHFICK